jgi:hypothetical protein
MDHACNPSYRSQFKASLGKHLETPYLKNTQYKIRVGGVPQVGEKKRATGKGIIVQG